MEDAVKALTLCLADDEIALIDAVSRKMDVDTNGSWKHPM